METLEYIFDWSELAFASKKPIKELKAVFIAAPREVSPARFRQIVKEYLPKHNILLGIAKEPYIDGFDDQPQFKTLQLTRQLEQLIDTINELPSKHKIYTLRYFQREAPYIFEKGAFSHVLLVNGSWHYTFHNRAEYYALANHGITYTLISPFADEAEALAYDQRMAKEMHAYVWPTEPVGAYSEQEMLALACRVSKLSLDYTFQTGVTLGLRHGTSNNFTYLAHSYNKVVPFQTYALHYGSDRERNFSPLNDLNHYDTVHAETMLMTEAVRQKLDMSGTTLFINLLPCPNCARMFTQTDIAEFVYSEDHSAGYAIQLLERAGKLVRRVIPEAV